MRADRLVSLVLLLQARGRTTAASLARELEVSVRTIYRDLEALSAAGVPVVAESGSRGGCRLLAGYRFPLRGLRPHEAEALLILGVPGALRDLGLGDAATSAHRQIQVTAGLPGTSGSADKLVHLDMPRWFHGSEKVSSLRTLAEALRLRRHLALGYPRSDAKANPDRTPGARSAPAGGSGPARGAEPEARPATRVVGPLGLVNKAGTWYLVAATSSRREAVFRVGRIIFARVLAEPFERPAGFDLAEFWDRWSAEFASTRPQVAVRVRASPEMLGVLSEVFGESVGEAIGAALPPDEQGWRELTLSFEHEHAAAHRLAGFGDQVEVLSPASVREELLATGRAIVRRYGAA